MIYFEHHGQDGNANECYDAVDAAGTQLAYVVEDQRKDEQERWQCVIRHGLGGGTIGMATRAELVGALTAILSQRDVLRIYCS